MKKLLMLVVAAASFLTACTKDGIKGSGPSSTRTFNLPAFHSVESHYDIAANISYGNTQEVTLTGYNNLMDILDLKVENGVLKLKYNTRYNYIRNGNLVANIKLPVLNRVAIHGSKDIEIKDFWQQPALVAGIYGSGNIRVRESAFDKLTSDIYGSGNVEAQGSEFLEVLANVYGSGHTSVTVMHKLVAKIFGSGNVYYLGSPAVEIDQHGSGRVIKR